jgi:type VI secretion system FHA domain protein
MPLRITIVSYCGRPPTEQYPAAVFPSQGGTLGRAPDNDLVLPDPEKVISRTHAVIRFENGAFYLSDTSLAGTTITNRDITLHRDSAQNTVRLENGDQLRIGDYDLTVMISEKQEPVFPASPAGFTPESFPSGVVAGADSGEDHDDLERLLNSGKAPATGAYGPPAPSSTSDYLRSPAHNESFIPPRTAVSPAEEKIPVNFNLADLLNSLDEPEAVQESADFPEIPLPSGEEGGQSPVLATEPEPLPMEPVAPPPPAPAPMPPAAAARPPVQAQSLPPAGPSPGETAAYPPPPPGQSDAAIRRQVHEELAVLFFEAAGIGAKPSLPPEEIAELLRVAGAFIREITGGLMTMLRGRMEMKNQFRVSRTIIATAGNNPLKFSLSAEDALKLLFVEKKPGFLQAVEAVQQGCRDIMNHEMAATAANQAALIAILKQFDPVNFSQQFKEGFVLQKKSKCWDMYCQAYPELIKNAQENFYGEDFAEAYEQQMKKLKAGARGQG